jgi:hypothetical protein
MEMEINAKVLQEMKDRIDVQGSIPGAWSWALAIRVQELEQKNVNLHLITKSLEKDRDYWMERSLNAEEGPDGQVRGDGRGGAAG